MPSTPGNSEGTLHIVATPIGNLGDITLRALEVLRSVDRIVAEDTRHSRKLLSHYDIHKPLSSYHSHNAREQGPVLIGRLEAGEDIALITDAGTPGISDPGAMLVDLALERGLSVLVIPGPTALIAALVASGLPTHPFAFLGFAPPKGSGRRRFFSSHAALPMTVILYESPQRLKKTLEDILQSWGDRRMAVARELTKLHEEIFRGTVSEALERFRDEARGEFSLVVAGAEEPTRSEEGEEWREELRQLILNEGVTVKEAAERVARSRDLSKKLVYREALGIKDSESD